MVLVVFNTEIVGNGLHVSLLSEPFLRQGLAYDVHFVWEEFKRADKRWHGCEVEQRLIKL